MRLTLLLVFSSILFIYGQTNAHFGGRSAGLGHASVALSDVWSTHHNQAGLGWLKEGTAGVFFQNKYLLNELNYMGFAFAQPLKSGAFGLSFTNFGSSLYGESKVGLGYGMQLSSKLTGGLQVNYQNTRIANNYGSNSGVTAELGIQALLTDEFMLAVHLYNPTRTKLNEFNNERIPTIMRLGLSYAFSTKVLALVEAEKDLLNRPIFKTGLEYKANEKIHFRAGIGNNPSLASFGFGLVFDQLKLDVAAAYHQTLGFSPELSLNYSFKKTNTSKASTP